MEILIVVGITIILSSLTFYAFSGLSNYQSLDKTSETVLSTVDRARTMSVSSQGNSEYGVRFSPTSVLIFKGSTYNSSQIVYTYTFSPKINSSYSLSSGTSDIVFHRLTGEPTATGTVIYSLKTASTTKTLTIYGTGVSEVQ